MDNSDTDEKCEEAGEKYLGEASYRTPEPCTPDTCVTSTLSCVCTDPPILQGDFQMESCRGLPQLTFGLLKPDGMEYLEEIETRMREEGFDIVQSRIIQLSPEQASNFYYEHYGQPYFPNLVTTMCDAPVKVYVLRKKDAVPMWRLLCGPPNVEQAKKMYPDSLRAIYGTCSKTFRNVCHASETEEKAREEIKFFFPDMVLDENFQNELNVEDYLKEWVNPTLLEGLTQLCKNKPLDPVQWLGEWLLMNNPFKPKMVREIAITPT